MKTITIGRLDSNDIVINNDPLVSREHCRITLQGSDFFIEDLKSKNGVFVNGWKISTKTKLKPKDVVVVGKTRIDWFEYFQKPEPKPEPELQKPAQQYVEYAPRPAQQKADTNMGIRNNLFYNLDKNPAEVYGERKNVIKNTIDTYCREHLCVRSQINQNVFSEDLFELSLNGYKNNFYFLSILLSNVEVLCSKLTVEYNDDMEKLNNYYNYLIANYDPNDSDDKINVVNAKKKMSQVLYDEIKTYVMNEIEEICEKFYQNNPVSYANEYSVAPSSSACWNNLKNDMYKSQRIFYIGDEIMNYNIFGRNIAIKRREYRDILCEKNIIFRYNNATKNRCYDIINTLIGRLLMSLPAGNATFSMIDIDDMNGTCDAFKHLNDKAMQILYRNDEIRKLYESKETLISNIIQNLLVGNVKTLYDYNHVKESKEPYHFLVIENFPDGMSSETMFNLKRIIKNGLKAGIGVVLMINEDKVNDSEDCRKLLHNIDIKSLEEVCHVFDITANSQRDFNFDVLSDNILTNIVNHINSGMEVSRDEMVMFSDYKLPQSEWWKGKSSKKIEVPFGVNYDKQIQKLKITQESGQNSVVVIGIPGSGKSVFLHTLICSAAINYSPDELNMYLIDFSGVEFNSYALHNLPHARVIAPEAEREFGLSILRELVEEGTRRMSLCREYNVNSIVDLKEKAPSLYVPRLLVIIDEYQKIFEIENDNISTEARDRIHTIVQEFRKFGINLILATQKLHYAIPKDMIANRVVFKSSQADFSNLIHSTDYKMPKLNTGECIYNSESGASYDNNFSKCFFINNNDIQKLLVDINKYAQSCNYSRQHEMLVFRGNEQPEFADRKLSPYYIDRCDCPNDVPIYFGENISVSDVDVHALLRKESGNNILVIGGKLSVAENIVYHSMLSAAWMHNDYSATFININLLRQDNQLNENIYSTFQDLNFDTNIISGKDDVLDKLTEIKSIIEERSNDDNAPQNHIYIGIYGFQYGRMFDVEGEYEDPSECSNILSYILKNGPFVGVFTILQCDTIRNLKRISNNVISEFVHRIALQMPENDSYDMLDSSVANKLFVYNRPSSEYRAYYRDHSKNINIKFKPYK